MEHTFVICAYKESPYLEICIRSLKAQTIKSELIIATSTPNEHIEKLAEKYAIPVVVGEGGGIGKDWNFALSCAVTDYVTLAHQDDVYFSQYTASILKNMQEADDAIIGFCDYCEIQNNRVMPFNKNLKIKKWMLSLLRLSGKNRVIRNRFLSFGSAICCPSVIYHMEKLRDFRFDENMKVSLDWDAWERLSTLKGTFCYVPKVLMGHRIHEQSATTDCIADESRTQEDLAMFGRFWPRCIAKILNRFYKKSQESNAL